MALGSAHAFVLAFAVLFLLFASEDNLLGLETPAIEDVRPSVQSVFRLDDLEASRLSIDISSKPAYTEEPPGDDVSETVEIATAQGQRFACRVRRRVAAPAGGRGAGKPSSRMSDDSPLSLKETTELLRPLETLCVYRVFGWWTYEYCHRRHLRQYHVQPSGEVDSEYVLGVFQAQRSADGSLVDEDGSVVAGTSTKAVPSASADGEANADGQAKPAAAAEGVGGVGGEKAEAQAPTGATPDARARAKKLPTSRGRALLAEGGHADDFAPKGVPTWEYDMGHACDVGKAPRRAVVQIRCHPDAGDHIASVVEPSTCVYHVVVNTPRLCTMGADEPTDEPVDPIVCQPLAAGHRPPESDRRAHPFVVPLRLKVEVTPADLMALGSRSEHYANVAAEHVMKSVQDVPIRAVDIEVVLVGAVDGVELMRLLRAKKLELQQFLAVRVPERLRAMQFDDFHVDEGTRLIRMERNYKIVLPEDGLAAPPPPAPAQTHRDASVGIGELDPSMAQGADEGEGDVEEYDDAEGGDADAVVEAGDDDEVEWGDEEEEDDDAGGDASLLRTALSAYMAKLKQEGNLPAIRVLQQLLEEEIDSMSEKELEALVGQMGAEVDRVWDRMAAKTAAEQEQKRERERQIEDANRELERMATQKAAMERDLEERERVGSPWAGLLKRNLMYYEQDMEVLRQDIERRKREADASANPAVGQIRRAEQGQPFGADLGRPPPAAEEATAKRAHSERTATTASHEAAAEEPRDRKK